MDPFSRLTGSRTEEALVRYVIAECRKSRDLASVLEDPYVTNRADRTTLQRLMDHPELVRALGDSAVETIRARIASL
jgi:hypothetical protein